MKKQEIITRFLDQNSDRELLNKAWSFGGKTYATNGNALLITDGVYGVVIDDNSKQAEKIKIVIPEFDGAKSIDRQLLVDALKNVPKVIVYEDCPDCEGSGEVEFDYESKNGRYYDVSFECPVCRGDGDTGREIGKECNIKYIFEIYGCYIAPKQIQRIVECCTETSELTFSRNGEDGNKTLWTFGNYKVLQMGVLRVQDSEQIVIKVI